ISLSITQVSEQYVVYYSKLYNKKVISKQHTIRISNLKLYVVYFTFFFLSLFIIFSDKSIPVTSSANFAISKATNPVPTPIYRTLSLSFIQEVTFEIILLYFASMMLS
ncbi:MAG: hypothetical protein PHN55_11150, partial [Dysgonamonadaceae bacterium]|nr:hypothetical protein [Dysgonamonadaceae bacterium]